MVATIYPAPYFRTAHGYAKGWRPMNTSNPIDNDNGTVALGGNVSTTGPISSNLISFPGVGGALIPRGRTGLVAPLPAGTFNSQLAGNYMVKGGSHMTTLAGVANTKLNSPARLSSFNPGIHSLLWRTSPNIASWNLLTGQPTYNTTATVLSHFGTDNAANPTAAIPGWLAYMVKGIDPTSDYYNVRYLW